MAYKVIILYQLYMPSYFLGTFTEYPDLKEAVITAVVNKRAGGMGLISGRKAFQKPMAEGVQLLHAIQDVYLDSHIKLA